MSHTAFVSGMANLTPNHRTHLCTTNTDNDYLSIDQGPESSACYFINRESFALEQQVFSGDDSLRCEEKGIKVYRCANAPVIRT